MRTALNNGQVDAIWTPEPFLSQALNLDGDAIVMAPGPVLGNYLPNGGYAALDDWAKKNPALAKASATAINQSLAYAQQHPDEIRALLPAGTQNVRLPVWNPTIDRKQLLDLAKYAKEFGVIASLPNFTQLFPSAIRSGTATGLIEATVGPGKTLTVRQQGQKAKLLDPGKYLVLVRDRSKSLNFHLSGPGLKQEHGRRQDGHGALDRHAPAGSVHVPLGQRRPPRLVPRQLTHLSAGRASVRPAARRLSLRDRSRRASPRPPARPRR
jgi:hypothetical protein